MSVAAETPVIAAASDLQFALEEIAKQFTAETALKVKLSFGSSGNFFRQISQGAPYELFMSADEQAIFALKKQGLTQDDGSLYGFGRLVLFAPKGSPIKPDAKLISLKDTLKSGRLKQFAIANPEHAPYGTMERDAKPISVRRECFPGCPICRFGFCSRRHFCIFPGAVA
jgi:molybdate transport system substrate-binding protein